MATKNRVRTIRFTDEIEVLIEQQVGNNFTEKFENLVTRCIWELPQVEKRLEDTNRMIQQKRAELTELQGKVTRWRTTIQNIDRNILNLNNALEWELTKEM